MKPIQLFFYLILATFLFQGCKSGNETKEEASQIDYSKGSFGYDLAFLQKFKKTLVLQNDKALVAVIPDYQGRVMTSSAKGMEGMSFGWLNYQLIESGENAPHFNNYGGEERFWLGPEGGQFSVFFKPAVSFTFDNWQVPAPIDSEPFELIENDGKKAVFTKEMNLQNYSNFNFHLKVDRSVEIMNEETLAQLLGTKVPDQIEWVGYTSVNSITNLSEETWSKKTGLLSIWILGQFISSPGNTVIAPFVPGPEDELGPIVNDTYFGKIPDNRLTITDSLILFKADGKQRGKIGLSPARSKNYLASYDSGQQVLTLVFFNKPANNDSYVNSMWELQEKPFGGDVINSYNDGPLEDGSQLGPFYELETSSPAADLKPGKSLSHISQTIHLTGQEESMNELLQSLFGITIADIKKSMEK